MIDRLYLHWKTSLAGSGLSVGQLLLSPCHLTPKQYLCAIATLVLGLLSKDK